MQYKSERNIHFFSENPYERRVFAFQLNHSKQEIINLINYCRNRKESLKILRVVNYSVKYELKVIFLAVESPYKNRTCEVRRNNARLVTEIFSYY